MIFFFSFFLCLSLNSHVALVKNPNLMEPGVVGMAIGTQHPFQLLPKGERNFKDWEDKYFISSIS